MSIRSIISKLRQWLFREETAKRLMRDKSDVQRTLTRAQERAENRFITHVGEISTVAQHEHARINALLSNAHRRLVGLVGSETLPPEKQAKAQATESHLNARP